MGASLDVGWCGDRRSGERDRSVDNAGEERGAGVRTGSSGDQLLPIEAAGATVTSSGPTLGEGRDGQL
jgi:hypothetical protein